MLNTTLITLALIAAPQECPKACKATQAQTVSLRAEADIVDTAVAAGKFETLVTAVKAAGLVETLKGEGPFTVFAPTDAAFKAVDEKVLAGLLKDKKALTRVLTYHVVPGRFEAKKVLGQTWLPTAQGQSLWVNMKDGKPQVDGAGIVSTDIQCSNGVIHVIDAVVMPRKNIVETAVAAGSFKNLVTAVKAAELVETLSGDGPFTVFAPADSAFAAIPAADLQALLKDKKALQGVLTFHVVPGRVLSTDLPKDEAIQPKTAQGGTLNILRDGKSGAVSVSGAKVVSADILCGNGVIHVIDTVLMPGTGAR